MYSVRRSLASLAMLCLAAVFHGTDYDWPNQGTLSIDTPEGWSLHSRPVDDVGYAFAARPEASAAAALVQISVVNLPVGETISPDELPTRLQESLDKYIDQSVEKECRPVRLRSRQGIGWYAELTDARLVGKPPVPDDYKVLRSALVALDDSCILVATMQFDDPDSEAASEMLAIVSSVRFVRRGGSPGRIDTAARDHAPGDLSRQLQRSPESAYFQPRRDGVADSTVAG